MSISRHPASVKARCLELLDKGRTPAEVHQITGISTDTLYDWRRRRSPQHQRLEGEKVVKSSNGSGVIAPAPYARGYVWPGPRKAKRV